MQKLAFKQVPLTAQQRRMWDDTMGVVSWMGPGFIHIIYTLLKNTGDEELALFTEDIEHPAATDGLQLIFKPSMYFKLGLMKRVFALFHEVMHVILDHCGISYAMQLVGFIELAGRRLPYSHIFSNIVQDYGINATLIKSKFGEFDPNWLHDPALSADEKDWVQLYFEMWRDPPKGKPRPGTGTPNDGTGLPGPGNDPGTEQPTVKNPKGKSFDQHLKPGEAKGKDPHEVAPRDKAQWEQAVHTAMELQRAQGKLPGALEHFFDQILKPKVDWAEQVRGEVTRISGSGAYSWQKIDRRMAVRGIGAPSVTGHSVGLIVEGCDSSGSIFQDKTLVARFIGETAGILEDLNPEEIRWLSCDTEIKQEFTLHDVDDLRMIKVVKGGGGTDFRPVFDYIAEHDLFPDALIYLTDGDGQFPEHEPDYPVIWGDISGNPKKYPWGRVIFIPTTKD